MKSQKIILRLLIVALLINSCSKNDDEIIVESPPQYPMKSLIESGHMELESTTVQWAFNYEIGYRFKSFKNGKIEALGIRVPENDEYRVTLWNAETEEILVTIYIVSTSGLLSFEDIEPINIESGVAYFISVNTNSYYSFKDSENEIFPVETGDILITDYGRKTGLNPDQMMPDIFLNWVYIGMVDIKFVPNN